MERENKDNYMKEDKNASNRSFLKKEAVWSEMQSERNPLWSKPQEAWWKRLSSMAAAVVLGLLAVWGLQEYREMTGPSTEIGASVDFYGNTEIRMIKSMNSQKIDINADLQQDLEAIYASQKLLKKALYSAPDNMKERIYNALIETYELKTQLLEKIIYCDHLERQNSNKTGTSL